MLQTGWDSSVNGSGVASSGGFTQLRYELSPRLFALARYEGTNDGNTGLARDAVLLTGLGVSHNSRFTVEDVVSRIPQTKNTARNTRWGTSVRFNPLSILTLVLLMQIAAGTAIAQGSQREIDLGRSRAQFSVLHVYIESVSGSVPILSGSLTMSEGSVIPTRIDAVLDARRMNTGDDDRDNNLQSPDWFDTKRFPAWTFSSTKIVRGSGTTFAVQDP